MVRVTPVLAKYIPEWYYLQKSSGSYFKKQSVLFMTRFHKNLAWSTFKNSRNRYQYYLKYEQAMAPQRSQHKLDINRARIAAACEEHGFSYKYLKSTLPKLDVHLTLSMLSRLAIYEPRTFKSLVDIAKDAISEELPQSNFDANKL